MHTTTLFFQVEDILMRNEHFRSGKCALRRVIRTNSDHLMLEMLRKTALCNLGSYWLPETPAAPFSRAMVQGFEGRVAFGCLRIDNKPLSAPAEGFSETSPKTG